MIERFPKFEAGHIFNEYTGTIDKNLNLKYNRINLEYPCRMDAMAINPAAVCYNDDLIFTPGEVVISVNRKIKVNIEVNSENGGILEITEGTQRKVLIKHAYKIMTKTLKVNPSLKIGVDASQIIKHCGFGSSSSTIAAVASAINELYNCPIPKNDLIKFLASNHGEEITDENEDELKMVQCIGGGATNGLTEEGIIIIAGKATPIAKMKYSSEVLIAVPKDFETKSAEELMKLEEENLWKFKKTGEEYSEKIAYDLLHKALPEMCNGSIKELANVVFDYRFNMGSIENCSFVYGKMIEQAKILRKLYENGNCELLTLSSVGPAFSAIVKDEQQKQICKKMMEKIGMNVIETSICNTTYQVTSKQYYELCIQPDLENKIYEISKRDFKDDYANYKPQKIDMTLSGKYLYKYPKFTINYSEFPDYPSHKLLRELKNVIMETQNIKEKEIIIGVGANGILQNIVKVLFSQGGNLVTPFLTFNQPEYAVTAMGGFTKRVYMKNNVEVDINNIIKSVDEKTKMIYICNPNNPTGILMENKDIIKIANKTQKYVVVDESAIEFSGKKSLIEEELPNNLIIVRSLSKSYGIANLRVGYMICSKVFKEIYDKNITSNEIAGISCEYAKKVLKSNKYKKNVQIVKSEREKLKKELQKIGLEFYESKSNILFTKTTLGDDILGKLYENDISVGSTYDENKSLHIRIAVQDRKTNDIFIQRLKKIFNKSMEE